jgi:hypothetical protein
MAGPPPAPSPPGRGIATAATRRSRVASSWLAVTGDMLDWAGGARRAARGGDDRPIGARAVREALSVRSYVDESDGD